MLWSLPLLFNAMTPADSLPSLNEDCYRILIRDLRVELCIGVNPEELLSTQEVLVNIALDARRHWHKSPESISEVVCYDSLARRLRQRFHGGRIALVEGMAEAIARECFASDERVLAVWVRVEKPDAVASARSVGVEIRRCREDPVS